MSQPKTRKELETSIIVKAAKDPGFRERLVSNPEETVISVLRELDPNMDKVRADLDIKVIEEPEKAFYLVLPHVPKQQVEISDEDLEKVAGGVWTENHKDGTAIIGY